MNFNSLLDNLQEHVNESTIVEVNLEEFKLRCLQYSFKASYSSLVVGVLLEHLHEILMSIQTVNVLRNQWKKIANQRKTMNLQLL